MANSSELELSRDKQSRFWAQPVTHGYKASVTSTALMQIVEAFVGRQVLDIGAADGSLMREIRRRKPGTSTTGIDLAPKSAEVRPGDCTRLEFAAAEFDTVFMTDVVEHLPQADLERALGEARRVLKSGGHLLVATPNEEDLSEHVILCPHCNQSFHRWGHCLSFSAASLSETLKRAGFEVVQTRTCNLAWLARRPVLSWFLYKSGITRLWRPKTFHHDLIAVACKA